MSRVFLKQSGHPDIITYFITNKCNAGCSFCIIKDELNKPNAELNAEEITKVISGLNSHALMIITGGEPLLSPHLGHAINELDCLKKVQHIAIPTNASMCEKLEDLLQTISLKNIETLTLSLSIDDLPAEHEAERMIQGLWIKISEFGKIVKRHQPRFKGKLLFHVSVVFHARNQNRMEKIISMIEDTLGPDSIGLTLVRKPAPPEFFQNLDYHRYIKLNSQLAKKSTAQNYLSIGHLIHQEKAKRVALESQEGKYFSPCYAGVINVVIKQNGDVMICENIKTVTGNLRDHNYHLPSLMAEELHFQTISSQQKNNCACGHECYVTPNVVYNPFEMSKVILKSLLPHQK